MKGGYSGNDLRTPRRTSLTHAGEHHCSTNEQTPAKGGDSTSTDEAGIRSDSDLAGEGSMGVN